MRHQKAAKTFDLISREMRKHSLRSDSTGNEYVTPNQGRDAITKDGIDLTDDYANFSRNTSGSWLYDEQAQMAKRYVKFDVQALQNIAGRVLDSRCVAMRKLLEGFYNKVISSMMENGKEILARIPNPNAG
jgi:hypothetical protein